MIGSGWGPEQVFDQVEDARRDRKEANEEVRLANECRKTRELKRSADADERSADANERRAAVEEARFAAKPNWLIRFVGWMFGSVWKVLLGLATAMAAWWFTQTSSGKEAILAAWEAVKTAISG